MANTSARCGGTRSGRGPPARPAVTRRSAREVARTRSRAVPQSAAAAKTHSTASSTCAMVPWKSNSTASTGCISCGTNRALRGSSGTPCTIPTHLTATDLSSLVGMTTEVLRNMLYTGSETLRDLGYVVMDEVHYLADRFRGAVWEEVIIHLPESVTLVSLSATVSNAEEFADWLITVRGETQVIVSEHRPVPLWQHMLVGKRMFDLFHDTTAAQMHEVHPELLRYTRDLARRLDAEGRTRPGRGRRSYGPYRPDVVERLDREGLLPAI